MKNTNTPNDDADLQPPVDVPFENLNPDTVTELIEAFILRDGTDYGAVEVSLVAKRDQVRRQLERGEIKIVFDPNTETVTLLTLNQWKKLQ